MHRKASLVSAVVCLLFFASAASIAQESDATEEIRSMLHIASGLIPQIDKSQQWVASNIAQQQALLGDMNGALATINHAYDGDRDLAISSLASIAAHQGNEGWALSLVQVSIPGNGQGKAQAYSFIAKSLAGKGTFREALEFVERMENCEDFFGKTSMLVETLMAIRAGQKKGGDPGGADATLTLALNAVEREAEYPFEPEFAQSMPANAYGTIASELAREGDRNAALLILEHIYPLIAQAPDHRHRQDTIFSLGYALANIGELQTARDTAEQLEPGQQRDGIMMLIAEKQATDADPLQALAPAMEVSDPRWRNVPLGVIADSLAASGNYVQALSTIDRIDTEAERANWLSGLAYQLADKNDPAAGFFLQIAWDAARNAGRETKPYVFAQIAVAKGMTGDFNHSLEIINAMADQDRFWAVQSLAQLLVHAGKKTEAIALAESQQSAYPKACAYLGIASQLSTEEREAAARNQRNLP